MRYIKKDKFNARMEKSNRVLSIIGIIISCIFGALAGYYMTYGHLDGKISVCVRNKSYLKQAVEQYRLNNKDKQIKDINEESIKLLLENKYLAFPLGKTTTPCKYYISNNNDGIVVLCNFHDGKK